MAGEEDRPSGPEGGGSHPRPEPEPRADDPALEEATAGVTAAELSSADRPAEAAAAALPAHPEPSSASRMPLILSLIGGVLIVLLAANLYGLYNPPANDAIPALQAEVAQLRQRLEVLPKPPPPPDLGPLESHVATLAEQVSSLKTAVDGAATGASAAAEAKAAVAPLAGKAADLQGAIDALSAQVTALPKVDLAPLTEKVDAVTKRLPPLEAYFAAPKAGEQVTQVRQNGSATATRAAPVAVIADGVLSSLGSGRPFATELRALTSLGVEKASLEPLEAVAPGGAATDAELAAGFAALQDKLVVAAAPVASGTMLDRMMANAQGLVKVSRTGSGPGNDAGATASRITAALKRGDLAAAAADWNGLPEASRTASADWAARLKARIAADEAARALHRSAVEALASSVPTP